MRPVSQLSSHRLYGLTLRYCCCSYPAGAFNLVTGTGKVAGEAIASHMDIDKVCCYRISIYNSVLSYVNDASKLQ